ncbi:MAG: hypothetical protein C5B48_13905, partial [Candidatus Rokuibacteriota bacterium]
MKPIRRSVGSFRMAFALLAALVAGLAGAAATVMLRELAQQREMAVSGTLGSVGAVVAEAVSTLRLAAALVARDPAVIEGAAGRDSAMLARFALPRVMALTRDGIADLVLVRDPAGIPLVQVPPIPMPGTPPFVALTDPIVTLRVVNGQPVWLAASPIWSARVQREASRVSLGTVVIGRRLDSLGRSLEGIRGRPGVVFLAEDRALASTRPGSPMTGWAAATKAGRVTMGSETVLLRPLPPVSADSPDGSLWALVPETLGATQWRLWSWPAGLCAVGVVSLAAGVFVIARGGRNHRVEQSQPAAPTAPTPRPEERTRADSPLYAETTAKHPEKTRALLEVAEILTSPLDPSRLLKQVAIKIAQVCRVDRCSIERWDGDRVIPLMSQFADGRRDERMWAAFLAPPGYPPRDVPAHAQAIETRRPVVIADAAVSDLLPREWTETFALKSVLVAPLIRQDAVIGVISLDYVERVTPFEPWQVDLAMAVAGQLALSVENTRLYGEAEERLRETTTLLRVARVISEPDPPVEVMRRLAREVAHAFGADMAGVYLLDAKKEALVPAAGYHVPKHLRDLFLTRPFVLARFPALSEAWRAGGAFWSSEVKNDPLIDRDTFEGVDPHSVLFASTMVRGEPVGALFLVWWGKGREFQPADIRLIEGVAFQVGLAMENAELTRQTRTKLEELSVLHELSRKVTGQLDQA